MKPRTFMAYAQEWGSDHPLEPVTKLAQGLGVEVLEVRPVTIADGWFFRLRGRPSPR